MTIRPVRLQLSRKAGFNLQRLSMETNGLEAVNVARPTIWGNPFIVGTEMITKAGKEIMTAEEAVSMYRWWISRIDAPGERETIETAFGGFVPDMADVVKELRGKNLACWCKPGEPCHADVLLEIANR